MTTKMINRTAAPDLQIPETVSLGAYRQLTLGNGVPVYIADNNTEDVVKIELCFPAGRWYEPSPMLSRAVCRLLTKGTSRFSSKELADRIEFYGASVETANGQDYTSVKIFSLGKYLPEIMPLVGEMLQDASMPPEELQLFQKKQLQKLQVGLRNTDFVANRTMHAALFGAQHPYGYAVDADMIRALDTTSMRNFSRQHYQPGLATVFLSGNLTDATIQELERSVGSQTAEPITGAHQRSLHSAEEQQILVPNAESVQSSIRIASLTIGKDHPDYAPLNVANTVLGGYFGSRLMSNIREDKGYTYGIYSLIRHHHNGSYFVIDTEVGNEVCRAAVDEIYAEMKQLAEVPVDNNELTVVRNYMLGSLIRATDGSFNRIQVIRNMVMSGLDFEYFDRLVTAVQRTRPEQIQELAGKYLDPTKQKEIICGQPI